MVQSHANDDFPVTLGSQVRWYPKAERWRIEVTDPQTMKAVWITHEALRRIVEADTLGAELVSGGSCLSSRNRTAHPPGGNGELEGRTGRPAPEFGRLLSSLSFSVERLLPRHGERRHFSQCFRHRRQFVARRAIDQRLYQCRNRRARQSHGSKWRRAQLSRETLIPPVTLSVPSARKPMPRKALSPAGGVIDRMEPPLTVIAPLALRAMTKFSAAASQWSRRHRRRHRLGPGSS